MIRNIKKADIQRKTAYNTYRVNGIPKGPISNPGKQALQAIFRPEESDYLYFVSFGERWDSLFFEEFG